MLRRRSERMSSSSTQWRCFIPQHAIGITEEQKLLLNAMLERPRSIVHEADFDLQAIVEADYGVTISRDVNEFFRCPATLDGLHSRHGPAAIRRKAARLVGGQPDQITVSGDSALGGALKLVYDHSLPDSHLTPCEWFVQAGSRFSPAHYDHGRVTCGVPRCFPHVVKVWIVVKSNADGRFSLATDGDSSTLEFALRKLEQYPASIEVFLQMPGDVVCTGIGVQHCVKTIYMPQTPPESQWVAAGGHVFVMKSDLRNSMWAANALPPGFGNGGRDSRMAEVYDVYKGLYNLDRACSNIQEQKRLLEECLPPAVQKRRQQRVQNLRRKKRI